MAFMTDTLPQEDFFAQTGRRKKIRRGEENCRKKDVFAGLQKIILRRLPDITLLFPAVQIVTVDGHLKRGKRLPTG